jgi:hypothetical protein
LLLAACCLLIQRTLAETAASYLTKQPELRMLDRDPKQLADQIMEAVEKAKQQNLTAQRSR